VSAFTKTIAALASGLAMLVLALAPTQSQAMVVTQKDAAFLALFSHHQGAMLPFDFSPDVPGSIYRELLDSLDGTDFPGAAHDGEPDGFYSLSQPDSLSRGLPGFNAVAVEASSIPEPATFALLLVALAASLVSVRRNGSAPAARLAAAAAQQHRLAKL
jgi:hypothetical protein